MLYPDHPSRWQLAAATCSLLVFVGGNAGDVHTNMVIATGTDDDSNPVSDSDDTTVTVSSDEAASEMASSTWTTW